MASPTGNAGERACALYQAGVQAVRQGDFRTARRFLRKVVQMQPDNEMAWLWLAESSDDVEEALLALARALKINPTNPAAKRGIRQVRRLQRSGGALRPPLGLASLIPPPQEKLSKKPTGKRLPLLAWVEILMLMLLTMGLIVAWVRAAPEEINQSSAPPVTFQAVPAHEYSLALSYAQGKMFLEQGKWEEAAKELKRVYETAPAYRDVRERLATAYYNLGLKASQAGELGKARSYLKQALELNPDWGEAEKALAEVEKALRPAQKSPEPQNKAVRPGSQGKRIEIDLSEQRLYAWEGDKLVYNFICSTGGPSSPTRPGHYKVLDKIPMAYSYTWNLKMPYWLGIYWAGSLENGIHALPILPNGQTLWEGYLGQRVSFGCIILGTEEAKTLYNWAEIGTPVIIRP